ncbi:SMI1/KNR4 family protein [Microcoleus sp. herbarium12]|uniref:SMI1/KNR4 family protein n=1 Tax=Microcoleus sp. herbarium12 TaxID=3055437 RepID=UPI002FCF6383
MQRHLGINPQVADGLSDNQIREAEKILSFQLPAFFRDYYRIVGNLSELNKAHNVLFDITELFEDNDFLIFMEENQAVVYWVIKIRELAIPEPEVWQQVNSNPSDEWYSEEMTFSYNA